MHVPAQTASTPGRVLITNDDGIDAPGLAALAVALERRGVSVVIAAPATNMSGAAAAIGPIDPRVPVRRQTVTGCRADAFAVHAPPAMIVIAAMGGAFGDAPTAVVSGVNHGVNLGRAVLHSGTVGAALTAHNLGLPAAAVSADVGADWEVAAEHGIDVFAHLLDTATHAMANVNVPASATSSTEVVITDLARFGAVTAALTDDVLDFQLTIDPQAFDEPGTDGAAVAAGLVSVSWLTGLTTAPDSPVEVSMRPVPDSA